MELPLVTVFTLIYNTNPIYIIEAIESVKENNYPNLQHIIIDDCSTNKTSKTTVKEWIKKNQYQCEFYEHDTNLGICGTLNHVIDLAKGKYLLGVCDDLISKDRIQNDVNDFETAEIKLDIVHSISQFIQHNSEKLAYFYPSENIPGDSTFYFNKLLRKNFISAIGSTIRLQTLKDVGGYDINYIFEDYPIWLKLSSLGYNFKFRPEVNSFYRILDESISRTKELTLMEETFLCQTKFANTKNHYKIIKQNFKDIYLNGKINKRILQIYMDKYGKDLYYWIIISPIPAPIKIRFLDFNIARTI